MSTLADREWRQSNWEEDAAGCEEEDGNGEFHLDLEEKQRGKRQGNRARSPCRFTARQIILITLIAWILGTSGGFGYLLCFHFEELHTFCTSESTNRKDRNGSKSESDQLGNSNTGGNRARFLAAGHKCGRGSSGEKELPLDDEEDSTSQDCLNIRSTGIFKYYVTFSVFLIVLLLSCGFCIGLNWCGLPCRQIADLTLDRGHQDARCTPGNNHSNRSCLFYTGGSCIASTYFCSGLAMALYDSMIWKEWKKTNLRKAVSLSMIVFLCTCVIFVGVLAAFIFLDGHGGDTVTQGDFDDGQISSSNHHQHTAAVRNGDDLMRLPTGSTRTPVHEDGTSTNHGTSAPMAPTASSTQLLHHAHGQGLGAPSQSNGKNAGTPLDDRAQQQMVDPLSSSGAAAARNGSPTKQGLPPQLPASANAHGRAHHDSEPAMSNQHTSSRKIRNIRASERSSPSVEEDNRGTRQDHNRKNTPTQSNSANNDPSPPPPASAPDFHGPVNQGLPAHLSAEDTSSHVHVGGAHPRNAESIIAHLRKEAKRCQVGKDDITHHSGKVPLLFPIKDHDHGEIPAIKSRHPHPQVRVVAASLAPVGGHLNYSISQSTLAKHREKIEQETAHLKRELLKTLSDKHSRFLPSCIQDALKNLATCEHEAFGALRPDTINKLHENFHAIQKLDEEQLRSSMQALVQNAVSDLTERSLREARAACEDDAFRNITATENNPHVNLVPSNAVTTAGHDQTCDTLTPLEKALSRFGRAVSIAEGTRPKWWREPFSRYEVYPFHDIKIFLHYLYFLQDGRYLTLVRKNLWSKHPSTEDSPEAMQEEINSLAEALSKLDPEKNQNWDKTWNAKVTDPSDPKKVTTPCALWNRGDLKPTFQRPQFGLPKLVL